MNTNIITTTDIVAINQRMIGKEVVVMYEEPFYADVIGVVDESTLIVKRGSLVLNVDIYDIRISS